MNKICTTIKQSKKLLELGLDPSTADMVWNIFVDGTIRLLPIDDWDLNKDGSGNVKLCYTWSLTALLELMPYFITIKEEGEPDEHYHFQLNRNSSIFRSKWETSYHGLKTERGKIRTHRIRWAVGPKKESDTPLDATFEMVCWLIKQEHIKVNK